jgi:hypothetical protein
MEFRELVCARAFVGVCSVTAASIYYLVRRFSSEARAGWPLAAISAATQ